MLRYGHSAATRRYAVEVSGWDSSECFFVVNCELLWNEETGKHVALTQKLRQHAVLFVRLLQRGHSERSHPVVYEAEFTGRAPSGKNEFRLNMLAPQLSEHQPSLHRTKMESQHGLTEAKP